MSRGRDGQTDTNRAGRWLVRCALLAIAVLALMLRLAGVWRGVDDGNPFHPDVPKQVRALEHYMQGDYVFYVHNRFYDGYPLFLAHVDEWIIRPVYASYRGIQHWMSPDLTPLPEVPPFDSLMRWTRLLHALYGFGVVLLVFPVARALRLGRPAALVAMAIAAFSPLSIAVAHFAAGDIGCDIFTSLVIAMLALHTRRAWPIWLVFAGCMAGFAFAAKYNGGLSALIIAAYVAADSLRGERRLIRFIKGAAVSFVGFLAALPLAIPQLVVDFDRTVSLIIKMVGFIKIYAVPEEVLALSPMQQTLYSFRNNGPDLWRSLGMLTLPFALLALIPALRTLRERDVSASQRRLQALLAAILLFTPLAMLIALVGKPISQPFHFSYLVIPVALGTVWSLKWIAHGRHQVRMALGVLFAAVCLCEHAVPALRNSFFWRRDDIETAVKQLLADPPLKNLSAKKYRRVQNRDVIVREMVVEDAVVSHFRNRPRAMISRDGPGWRQVLTLPVPPVCGRQSNPWVFLNGPAMPRSDRVLQIPQGQHRSFEVVTSAPLCRDALLQAGVWPVKVIVDAGGSRQESILAPHEARWIVLKGKRSRRRSAPEPMEHAQLYTTTVRLEAVGGNAWLSIANGPREKAVLEMYHRNIPESLAQLMKDVERAPYFGLLKNAYYLHGDAACEMIDAGSRKRLSFDLDFGDSGLAAGFFVFEAQVVALDQKNRASFVLQEQSTKREVLRRDCSFEKGLHVWREPFSKTVDPYECRAMVKAVEGRLRVLEWSVRPNLFASFDHLRAVAEGEPVASLRSPTVPHSELAPIAMFRCGVELLDTHLRDDTVRLLIRFADIGTPPSELEFFVHLLDVSGNLVHSIHVPVLQCAIEGGPERVAELKTPTDLAPGTYSVDVGMWNTRIEKRIGARSLKQAIEEHNDKLLAVGRYTTR